MAQSSHSVVSLDIVTRFFAGGGRTVRGLPMTASAGSMCSTRSRLAADAEPGDALPGLPMAPRSGVRRCGQRVPVDFRRAHPGSRRVHGVGLRLVTPFALFRVDYGKRSGTGPRMIQGESCSNRSDVLGDLLGALGLHAVQASSDEPKAKR